MTFYRIYKNKQAIAQVVLKHVYNNSKQQYRTIMDDDIAFKAKVRQIVQLKHNDFKGISEVFIKDFFAKYTTLFQNSRTLIKSIYMTLLMIIKAHKAKVR